MADMLSVAKYITERQGDMTAMKLQKLMYYAQAWHMVWAERPLFDEDFQAWANGPVLPTLYNHHRGMFYVSPGVFPYANSGTLHPDEQTNIDKVLGFYGQQTAQWLSNLTHQEMPWLQARGGLYPGAASSEVVSKLAMHEYYSGL